MAIISSYQDLTENFAFCKKTFTKGSFINDVAHVGGRGVSNFVTLTLSIKFQVKQSFYCDGGGRLVSKNPKFA